QGTGLQIDFDKAGKIFVSWIQGVGNAAEAYVAKGAAATGYAGYVFSAPVQITDDEVEDRDLHMQVTESGHVTVTTAKADFDFRHDDLDVYSYTLDGAGSSFTRPRVPELLEDTGQVLNLDHYDWFLADAEAPEAVTGQLSFNPYYPYAGVRFDFLGAGYFRSFFQYKPGFSLAGEGFSFTFANETKIGVNIAKFPSVGDFAPGDLEITFLLKPSFNASIPPSGKSETSFSLGLGFVIEMYFDLFGASLAASSGGLATFLRKWGPKLEGGVFGEFIASWDIVGLIAGLVGDEGQDGIGLGGLPPVPLQYIDAKTGEPITGATAFDDASVVLNLRDYGPWLLDVSLAWADNTDSAAIADGGGQTSVTAGDPFGRGNFNVFAGPYLKASAAGKTGKIFKYKDLGIKGRLGVYVDADVITQYPYAELNSVGGRTVVDLYWGRFFRRVVDVSVLAAFGEDEPYAAAPATGDVIFGGTSFVYDEDALAFEGLRDGSVSDEIDVAGFNYVLGRQIGGEAIAYGVYIREAIDPKAQSLNSVYTIEGIFDEDTGELDWLPQTARQLEGSTGLSLSPYIELRGENEDELVVVFGNTPPDDPFITDLLTTPPGKSYVILSGAISEGGTIALEDLTADPTAANGFFYSNEENYFAIGASVARLGDFSPGLGPEGGGDFAFGAPEADGENGKAYIIFGHRYSDIFDIDALNGLDGFSITGVDGEELGTAISTAGDYNGDGIPDIAISAPGAFDHTGAVYIVYGGREAAWAQGRGQFTVDDVGNTLPGEVILGATEAGRFGAALSGGYDVTGDGADDLAVGSLYNGTVTLFSRDRDPIVIVLDAGVSTEFNGPDSGNTDLGGSFALLPDVNGDGVGHALRLCLRFCLCRLRRGAVPRLLRRLRRVLGGRN
ncbi:MAG: integrin alpha, partial [Pseudomonadota bacterium]